MPDLSISYVHCLSRDKSGCNKHKFTCDPVTRSVLFRHEDGCSEEWMTRSKWEQSFFFQARQLRTEGKGEKHTRNCNYFCSISDYKGRDTRILLCEEVLPTEL